MTLDLTHLPVAVREEAFGSHEQRIRYIHTTRWISHPRAQIAIDHFERLFNFPACARMPCVLLFGESGIGKTMVVEKFSRAHRAIYNDKLGREIRPVIVVQMPPAPDERRLYAAILSEVGVPFYASERLAALEQLAQHILAKICPRVLIIDEVHNLLAGTERDQRRALNVLKNLANKLQIVVILVGTRDALQAIQTDAQVERRFDPLELPRWTESDGFRAFVASVAKVMPLRRPSAIADRQSIEFLLRVSQGITAHVCRLIGQAAEAAIINNSEMLDLALLQWVSSHRPFPIH